MNNVKVRSEAHKFTIVFYRWLSYIQEKIIFKRLKEKASSLYKLRLLSKCFWALRTEMSMKDILQYRQNKFTNNEYLESYFILRNLYDLEEICKRFICHRKKALSQKVRSKTRKYYAEKKKQGQQAKSFKSFIFDFEKEVSYRSTTEQNIVARAFEFRGQLEFIDVIVGTSYKIQQEAIDPVDIPDAILIRSAMKGFLPKLPLMKSNVVCLSDAKCFIPSSFDILMGNKFSDPMMRNETTLMHSISGMFD